VTAPGATPGARDRLLEAAERLLAERGTSATSVRDVLTAADVANAAAVGYYFGNKEGLVAEVERRVVEQVNARRSAALDGLGSSPALEQLVAAWAGPLVELRCSGRGSYAARVFMRIFDEPREAWDRNGATAVMEVGWRYLAASAPLLPGADQDELLWRWQSVTAVLAFYAHGYLEPFGADSRPDDAQRHLARLVPQLSALLRA